MRGGDCDEMDPLIFPGQVFQAAMRFSGAPAFDFNCDGWEEPEYPGQRYVSCGEGTNACAHMGAQWVEFTPAGGHMPTRRAACASRTLASTKSSRPRCGTPLPRTGWCKRSRTVSR